MKNAVRGESHATLDGFNKYKNTAEGLTCQTTKVGASLLLRSNARVFHLHGIDLGGADRDLLEEVVVLQHALKHREEQRA